MKTITALVFLLLLRAETRIATVPKIHETIYVQCFQEKESEKFYFNSKSKGGLMMNFFFNVDWTLHNFKRDQIMFLFDSSNLKNSEQGWFIKKVGANEVRQLKNVFTLEQFVKKLNDQKFLLALPSTEVIMIYGAKCSDKFEMYPVKVGTDLSSEG